MAFQSGPAATRFAYRPELDGVRAVAILLVFWHHSGILGVPRLGADFLGVDIFFVLSGYLITTLLLDERTSTGRVGLGAFYARRALRLLPALALMLVVAAIAVYASGIRAEIDEFRSSLPWVVAYAANWRTGDLGILTHTWSLAIEEQFYLLWPPVLVLALRRSVDRRALALVLVLTTVALATATAGWGRLPGRSSQVVDVFMSTYARAIAIIMGCLVALVPAVWRRARDPVVGALGIVGATAVLLLRKDTSIFHYRIGFFAFALFVTVALAHVVHAPDGAIARALRVRPLVEIGRVSYGIYLFHVPVIVFLRWERPVPMGLPALLVAIAGTGALVVWSFIVVERPALRLQERFRRRPSGQIARASTAE